MDCACLLYWGMKLSYSGGIIATDDTVNKLVE